MFTKKRIFIKILLKYLGDRLDCKAGAKLWH